MKKIFVSPFDYFLIWSGAAISLAEIWAGGGLFSLGFLGGLMIILAAHFLGGLLIGLAGYIGGKHQISSMQSLRISFGVKGSFIGSFLNFLQLLGWTAIMILIGSYAMESILGTFGRAVNINWIIIFIGVFTTLWSLIRSDFWKIMQKFSIMLLFMLCLYISYVYWKSGVVKDVFNLSSAGNINYFFYFDLVFAFVISWMPLASDYLRFSRNPRKSCITTFAGYFIMSSLMFVLGLVIGLVNNFPNIKENFDASSAFIDFFAKSGIFLPTILIILFSTFTTTFMDIYSGAVSLKNIFNKFSEKFLVIFIGILGTLIAIIMKQNLFTYENFLFFIGAMFAPLFAVLLLDFYFLKKKNIDRDDLLKNENSKQFYFYKGFNIFAFLAWILGVITFYLCSSFGFYLGASIPSMFIAASSFYLFKFLKF